MSFQIQKATRQGIVPFICLYSESGCGKTMSALLLARGLAGPSGKIVVADSESRRASLYADVIPGGFDTFDLCEPFSPQRYIEATDCIEDSGAAVGIIDSGSHEWEGPGGVLDTGAANENRSGKAGLHNWREPKVEHQKFVSRLLRAKIPIIVCLRAKYKTRQMKDDKGKTVIIKDDFVSPLQGEEFIFEATAHAMINRDHTIVLTKWSHPDLKGCFPEDNTSPLTSDHGAAIGRWCKSVGVSDGFPAQRDKALKANLWNICKEAFGSKVTKDGALMELRKARILGDSQTLESLDANEMKFAIEKLEIILDERKANNPF